MSQPTTNERQVKVTLRGELTDLMALLGKVKDEGVTIVKQGSFIDPSVERKGNPNLGK